MVRCRRTKPPGLETTLSTRSSVKRGLENTSRELSLLIWNLPLLVSNGILEIRIRRLISDSSNSRHEVD